MYVVRIRKKSSFRRVPCPREDNIRRGYQRWLQAFSAVAMAVITTLGLGISGASATSNSSPTPASSVHPTQFAISVLPNGKPLALSTPSGDAFFSLYVPTGTTPVAFTATILTRGPITGGIVTVTTPTSVYPVDITSTSGLSPLSVPLSEADVVNGAVAIGVHVDLNVNSSFLNPNGCTSTASIVAQIQSAAGVLSGAVLSPSTPADFWPPSLAHVTIWLPRLGFLSSQDARFASQASMEVAAIVGQQYGPNTKISFAEGAPKPHPIDPLVRDVAVMVGGAQRSSSISVENVGGAPVLFVEGWGTKLVSAGATVSRADLALATAPTVGSVSSRVDSRHPVQYTTASNGTRNITLAQFGIPTVIEGLGTVDDSQALPQAQFGTPISSLQVRVQANYTPPPPGGVATFSILVGNYIVASQGLGNAGTLSMDANVPTSVLSRAQEVDFRLNYSPPGGFCHSGLVPVEVTLNPASGFVAQPGQTLAPGFSRSPQNVVSGINVQLASENHTTLEAACRVIVSLAQILPYAPSITMSSPALATQGNQTELVVGATPSMAKALHAPLLLGSYRVESANGTSLGYSVDQPFAALEAFSQNGRDVILLGTYRSPYLAGELARELNQAPTGWFALGVGQVAVTTGDGKLRLINSSSLLPQFLGAATGSSNVTRLLIGGAGFIVLLILLRGLWLSTRMFRLRRAAARRESDGKSSEDGPLGRPQ